MEVHKVFMDWKTIYGEDINSPKLIYILKAILIKTRDYFFFRNLAS